MTSLLPRPLPAPAAPATGLRRRPPLLLVAGLGGLAAAGTTLLLALTLGVLGWFLTDAGAHGAPHDGLRAGGYAWLLAHGAGVHVGGTPVTVVPLGLTALAALVTWRLALRVGEAVSGHGPDADRISDGERDWTVPVAAGGFTAGYLLVTVVTVALVATPQTSPSAVRAVLWSVLLGAAFAVPGIAVGSGRAAIWAMALPVSLRAAWATARRILSAVLLVSAVVLLLALLVDLDTAANVLSQLHTDSADTVLYLLVTATLVPNAVVFAASYLLGAGFAVGVHTVVTPTAVVLGPLPMFPLLAALPDAGPPPAWTVGLLALPPLAAAVGAGFAQRRQPTLRWDEAALTGGGGGVLAGVLVAVLAAVSGGAVGPGRMGDVGPVAMQVLVHAVPALAIGGLTGALAMTWWQRRAARLTRADG